MNALFTTALNELEMLLPTTEQAIEELAASFLVPLAEGLCSPSSICSRCYNDHRVIEDAWNPRHKLEGKVPWGPINEMRGFYYQYDYPGESTEATDEECLAFATQWSRKYWRSILDSAWLTPTAQFLAAAIDADRAFDRLPILADASKKPAAPTPMCCSTAGNRSTSVAVGSSISCWGRSSSLDLVKQCRRVTSPIDDAKNLDALGQWQIEDDIVAKSSDGKNAGIGMRRDGTARHQLRKACKQFERSGRAENKSLRGFGTIRCGGRWLPNRLPPSGGLAISLSGNSGQTLSYLRV